MNFVNGVHFEPTRQRKLGVSFQYSRKKAISIRAANSIDGESQKTDPSGPTEIGQVNLCFKIIIHLLRFFISGDLILYIFF